MSPFTSVLAGFLGLGGPEVIIILVILLVLFGGSKLPELAKGLGKSIKEFKTSCGEVGWNAVDHIAPLLALFREKNLPVLYPYVAPKENFDVGRLAEKVPALMGVAAHGYQFVPEVAPLPHDVLLPKKHPSAFFGTPLASYLIDLQVDSLVVTGCTTSGCVRGSVVDAFAYNFKCTVPIECVYDRSATSHAVNLFDMAAKYAEVKPVAEVMQYIRSLPKASS